MATSNQSKTLLSYSPRLSQSLQRPSKHEKGQENLFSSLATPSTNVESVLVVLDNIGPNQTTQQPQALSTQNQPDELTSAVLIKCAVTTLSLAMDRVLNEALQIERELDWWRSVESSRLKTAYYILQSKMPPFLFAYY